MLAKTHRAGIWMVVAATLATCIPQTTRAAEQLQVAANSPRGETAVFRIRDVELNDEGVLSIQVLDRSARPARGVETVAGQNGKVFARETASATGMVAFPGLRPGVYDIATAEGSSLFRVWAPRTAPPSALKVATIHTGASVVRGQTPVWKRVMIISGIVVTSGVIGGVIGYNAKDDAPAS